MNDSRDQVFQGPSGSSRRRRIVLEFENFRDFIQAFSPVVSEEGMFVGSELLPDGLPAAGEELDFEVALSDDFRLVHGRGEVAWVRETDGPEGGAGVAVRFLDLDEPSRRLVTRLLGNYTRDGGQPFRIDRGGPAGSQAVEPEPLARSEADELFSTEAVDEAREPELLDAISPSLAPPFAAPDGGDQAAVPTLELDVEAINRLAPGDDIFDLPVSEDSDLPEIDSFSSEASPIEVAEVEPPEAELPEALQSGAGVGMEPRGVAAAEPVISEEIAQIADELSGVHQVEPVEMPSDEDRMSLSGAGRASDERPAWRTPLLASLAGIVLAAGVWFFAGDQVKSLVGLGDSGAEAAPAMPEAAPALPVAGSAEPTSGDESTVSEPEETESPTEGVAVSEIPGESVDEAVVQEEPMPAAVIAGARASRVEEITWQVSTEETIVSIVLDGPVSDGSYEVVRIRQGAPREVIKISGVSRPFSPKQLEVGSGQVERLRTGLHTTATGSEIHVVADLTGPAAAVTLVRVEGRRILVTFS